jgi:hypothetical protein
LSQNWTDPSNEGVQRRPVYDLESAFDCGINTLEAEALRRALQQRPDADFPAAPRSTANSNRREVTVTVAGDPDNPLEINHQPLPAPMIH